jgi:uncharacterized membrane protein
MRSAIGILAILILGASTSGLAVDRYRLRAEVRQADLIADLATLSTMAALRACAQPAPAPTAPEDPDRFTF